MGVYDISKIIKNARNSAGLTQEEMAEGICSVVALSNIENGKCGISPSTFSLLMDKAGITKEAYPFFENIDDFKTFLSINHARFYIEHWKSDSAYSALKEIKNKNFNKNKFYYQEFLILEVLHQLRTCSKRYDELLEKLNFAIGITHSEIDFTDIRKQFLSSLDLECLLLIAYIYHLQGKSEESIILCSQVKVKLDHMHITGKKLMKVQILYLFVYSAYLIGQNDYDAAFEYSRKGREIAIENNLHSYLVELTLIYGISMYMKQDGDKEMALQYIGSSVYSADALGSALTSRLIDKIKDYDIQHSFELSSLKPKVYELFEMEDISDFGDGSFDILGKDVLSIGKLISTLRKEQKISQQTICQGLCSKSKLSKIESGTQDGDILLLCAILNRLGYSESEFDFYGSKDEERYFKIISYLNSTTDYDSNKYLHYLEELKHLGETHPLMMQEYYLHYSSTKNNIDDRLHILNKALAITLPDFNISRLLNYRLSAAEISLIVSITYELTNKSHCDEAFQYFSQMENYVKENSLDILFSFRFYPIIKSIFIRYKYTEKMFGMLSQEVANKANISLCSFSIASLSTIYYHYSMYYKNNAECNSSGTILKQYSCYAKALTLINDNLHNYKIVKESL
ncbi:helix-turn-helix domain-containing protein [Butyrivibrio sp. NC3005]|uniref:helix-turn-helix domain-containing protein n=1 Tax=Butyrivibrio sp. NC3005 TaxID=1280685 RepID=UPI000408293B|nr:helix-turn-helix domain-containing protein [Butyrivibrio sp. NC3005]